PIMNSYMRNSSAMNCVMRCGEITSRGVRPRSRSISATSRTPVDAPLVLIVLLTGKEHPRLQLVHGLVLNVVRVAIFHPRVSHRGQGNEALGWKDAVHWL